MRCVDTLRRTRFHLWVQTTPETPQGGGVDQTTTLSGHHFDADVTAQALTFSEIEPSSRIGKRS
jgi:hypothetical protein